MLLHWLDRIGDWNPQFLREFKGRLKPRNLTIAGGISLLVQFLLLMTFTGQLPSFDRYSSQREVYSRYCTGGVFNSNYINDLCQTDALGNFVINWSRWWLDVYLWLSVIGIFILLIAGTYMLINDLAQEERRGTLNFIRLSPQSSQTLLIGKLLGVPILLYLVGILAIPLNLWAGINAGIPIYAIVGFLVVVLASCWLFYSGALLFGLLGYGLSGFQPWLGSGLVMMLLFLIMNKPMHGFTLDWINLFSPAIMLPHLERMSSVNSQFAFTYLNTESLKWFFLSLGANFTSTFSLVLVNFAIWSYWIWQALERRFPNPSKTVLSKGQSYLLVACFEVVALGFAVQTPQWSSSTRDNFSIMLVLNLILFLGLIAALSPQRQALLDWARYRRERVSSRKGIWSRALIQDLIWAEKSPAIVAIALNLAIGFVILFAWLLVWPMASKPTESFAALVISTTLTLIYAAIAQFILLTSWRKRNQWAICTIATLVVLPPFVLSLLTVSPNQEPFAWLFSAFPWTSIEHASLTSVMIAFLSQVSFLAFINVQFTRQIRKAGESATKALLAGRPY